MADTGPAKLPGLQVPKLNDPAMARWVQAVSERMEVREGARGNPAEAVVLQRDLAGLTQASNYLLEPKRAAQPGDAIIDLGGGLTASVAVDQFAETIRNSKLYKYLMMRLDDPHRFDDLPEEVRKALLRDLAEEAAKLGADITRVETKFQSSLRSLAMLVEQLTASVGDASAGVREVTFAVAEQNHAQAGKITQVVASLGNYFQDGAPGRVTIESEMIATADRVDGLEGRYTLKINAGRAVAGFGILASDTQVGTDSSFIVQADKFALVSTVDVNGLTNDPSLAKIPFGVDTGPNGGIYMNSNVYLKGTMKIDGLSGVTLSAALQNKPTNVGINGTVWNSAGATAAILATRTADKQYLVIGDSVTLLGTGETHYWSGAEWIQVTLLINGNALVNGSVSANKLITSELVIPWSQVSGTSTLNQSIIDATAAANAANAELAKIASDAFLSPGEWPTVKRDYDAIESEVAGLQTQATLYGITTEYTNYHNAYWALHDYVDDVILHGIMVAPTTDVAINAAEFSGKFNNVYSARQTLLNKIATSVDGRNTTAQHAADDANQELTNIASDGILSPGERSAVKLDFDTIILEQPGIDAQAASYGITAEKTNYDTAIQNLTSYLAGLPGWSTFPYVSIPIDGDTFRGRFSAVYTSRQTLLNRIGTVALNGINGMTVALSGKLDVAAKNVLTGSGGIRVGSIDWASNGAINSGTGVGITAQGIAAMQNGAPTFVLNANDGSLTINQIDVIHTLNIDNNAVTVTDGVTAYGTDAMVTMAFGHTFSAIITVTVNFSDGATGATCYAGVYAAGGVYNENGANYPSQYESGTITAVATASNIPAGTYTFGSYHATTYGTPRAVFDTSVIVMAVYK